MAKIDFGYNNDDQLNSQFEGYNTTGEYVDVIYYNGGNYLISNIQGQYNVIEICQDVYQDGSYATYATSAISEISFSMGRILNKEFSKNQIASGLSVLDVLKLSGLEVHQSNLRPVISGYEDIPGIVTSVKPEIFEDLKNTYLHQHSSFYALSKQIEELQMQLNQLQQEQGKTM